MEIMIKRINGYKEVKITVSGATIELGLFSEYEGYELAKTFSDAAKELWAQEKLTSFVQRVANLEPPTGSFNAGVGSEIISQLIEEAKILTANP